MKLHTVTTVLLVVACLSAVGVASTTLESTVETAPDEVFDLDYDVVPISPDAAGSLKRAMERSDAGPTREQPQAGAGEAERRPAGSDAGDRADRRSNPASGATSDSADRSDGGQSQRADRPSASDAGSGLASESLLDRLLDRLAAALPYLVALAVAVVLAALLVRHGDRLRSLFAGAAGDRRTPPPEPEPQNAVERAWLSVLAAAGVEDPWRRTTGECATAAVERGLDPEAVERLRRVFEEVRYGDREVTESRRRRMEQSLAQLDLRGVER